MKTKFALVRYSGKEELNTEFMRKFCKCEDIVMLSFDARSTRRNQKKCKAIADANWSDIATYELIDLNLYFKKCFTVLGQLSRWMDDSLNTVIKEEIFMFSNDANLSYINLMKDEGVYIYAFEINKRDIRKIEESREYIAVFELLTSNYINSKRVRDIVLTKMEFDCESKKFIEFDVGKIEEEIFNRYENIFKSSLKNISKIIYSGWS